MAYLSALRRTSSSLLRKTLTLSSSSSSFSRISSRHCFSASLFNRHVPDSVRPLARFCTTTPSSEPDSSRPSWAAAAELDDTVIIEGCDFEHWLVIMGFPEDPKPSEEEMVDTYIKTLAAVVGSEEEAKKKIYSVSTTTYTGFGALISRELSKNLKGLPGVLWVLPDSYLDVPSKDYGGDLLIDGKVVPRPEFRFREQEERVEYDFSDVEESEVYEEHEKRTEDSEESSLLFERLRETMENLKQSESEDSEETRGEPTKNAETKAEGRTEKDLEGLSPVFDRLREKMKTLKQEPSSHKDLEETADEKEKAALFDRLREKIMNAEKKPLEQSKSEESEGHVEESEDEKDTAALFDRLREQMKNLKIENSGEHPDWPDMWPDEYYEKAQEPKKKVTQERLDVMKLQIQKFSKEIMQHKAENNDSNE